MFMFSCSEHLTFIDGDLDYAAFIFYTLFNMIKCVLLFLIVGPHNWTHGHGSN